MSFYTNNCNNNRPSCINPKALNNICEKVLIETTRVFDACLSRTDGDRFTITVSDFSPAGPALPLTYVSTLNDPNNPATITSISINRDNTRGCLANVSLVINIPLIVNYVDANGVAGVGTSSISVSRSAILCVPSDSLTPISIRAIAFFSSTIGSFTTDDTASITACTQVIIKVVGTVDLLIPSFGYPCIPECEGASEANCDAFFDQPLYPPRA